MYYSYSEFLDDLKQLREKVEESIGIPDALICIARGGMIMGHMLSLAWNLRTIYTINVAFYSDNNVQSSLIIENMPDISFEHKTILVVNEIIDSGNSLEAIMYKLRGSNPQNQFYAAVIFQKLTAKMFADFYIKHPYEWIDFFWEVDMLKRRS